MAVQEGRSKGNRIQTTSCLDLHGETSPLQQQQQHLHTVNGWLVQIVIGQVSAESLFDASLYILSVEKACMHACMQSVT